MNNNIKKLQKFRTDTYNLLGCAKDSTYDLIDAVLSTRRADSLADFSLSPLFRRQWPSTYESLQDCRPNRSKLMERYLQEISLNDDSLYVTLAIDHTANPRLNSPTLKDRGYHHSPKNFQKVTEGHNYSTIAWIPEEQGSWALSLRHERISSFETPISQAAGQLKQVRESLNHPILALLDSEYGNASWVNQTVDVEVDCLIRIRSNCCLYGAPGEYSGRGRVAQSMFGLLVEMGTPATDPKTRGKSPGWQKGKKRKKKPRYPIVKKGKGTFESQKKTK